mmetsp:Transcript_118720/g.369885  ORF Transcript_118720/g.369885 Transcript_118720/m.369885 type:complete len:388 (+) Transcript_118720:75-1238(+)|eukprot:CAMPEP_0204581558 /NCGR_PEP_ID=MMETSP0661-20131031/44716_1 /ASSEMBLY_ACC=CAM_ASM_000606 /TAXON_ID=109239 /ORGANISM="Alexandrium margalefi, Strain AMGDE01CS-322" /LENGTH=387 /DNA_ID=CAMNT_0051590765 /DNA_START=75 /DNA_END=1238 /DNA_ORIENTATION=+
MRPPRWLWLLLAFANTRGASALFRVQGRGDPAIKAGNQRGTDPAYRIAILTAGTLVRYFPDYVARNLIAPLVLEGHTIDYYLSLNTEGFGAWRGYARTFRSDPIVEAHRDNLTFVAEWLNISLSRAGAHVRELALHEQVDVRTPGAINFAARASGFHRGMGVRTAFARSNLLKLLWQFEWLWGSVQRQEAVSGRYDFVMTNRDDLLWVQPFSLKRVLQAPDRAEFAEDPVGALPVHRLPGPARGYHMRCLESEGSTYDAQKEEGLTEYVLLLERGAAAPFLSLFSRLTENPQYWHNGDLERLLAAVAEERSVRFAALPAALVPAQRAGRVQWGNATVTCLHKACDSATDSVDLLRPTEEFPICEPQYWQFKTYYHLPIGGFPRDRVL